MLLNFAKILIKFPRFGEDSNEHGHHGVLCHFYAGAVELYQIGELINLQRRRGALVPC